MLSDEDIQKYQEIYKINFGVNISQDQAYEQGAKLIRLIELIYKPISIKELNQIKQNDLTNNY